MNESFREQLEKLYCEDPDKDEPINLTNRFEDINPWNGKYPKFIPDVKQCSCVGFTNRGEIVTCNCNVQEPVLKPTDLSLNVSNDLNPTSDRLKCDEGLKRE